MSPTNTKAAPSRRANVENSADRCSQPEDENRLENIDGNALSRPEALNEAMAHLNGTGEVTGSRQVQWFTVYEYVEPFLSKVGSWPIVGTPAWVRLPADNPAKIAAILDAATRDALRIDTEQTAMAEASHDVADSADWPAIAREHLRRYTTRAYIPREEVA